jgi:hypothetical protein
LKIRLYICRALAFAVVALTLVAPAVAAAMGACAEPNAASDDIARAFEYLDAASDDTMMSLRVDATVEAPQSDAADEPDCSTLEDGDARESDPAFAACYDSVDLPVSTIPSLFAEHQADVASMAVLGKVGDILGKAMKPVVIEPVPGEASMDLTPAQRVRQAWKSAAQSMPRHEAACTTESPDTCRSAPAIPSFWIPEISSSVAAQELHLFEAPPSLDHVSTAQPLGQVATLASRTLDVPTPPPR